MGSDRAAPLSSSVAGTPILALQGLAGSQRPCAECDARWLPVDEERWRAYLGGDDLDEPPELVFYCRECAEREFYN